MERSAPRKKETFLTLTLTQSIAVLLFPTHTNAGEYCHGFFDATLKYHNGFYCMYFCCGQSNEKYCCGDEDFRFEGGASGGRALHIDASSWNNTFWIMIGCVIGALGIVASILALACCICCRPNDNNGRPGRTKRSQYGAIPSHQTAITADNATTQGTSRLKVPPPPDSVSMHQLSTVTYTSPGQSRSEIEEADSGSGAVQTAVVVSEREGSGKPGAVRVKKVQVIAPCRACGTDVDKDGGGGGVYL